MQKVMTGEALVFRNSEVRRLVIPKCPELAISKVWPILSTIPRFNLYFPEEWAANFKKVDRDFMWDIAGTLDGDFVHRLVDDILKQREEIKLSQPPREPRVINATTQWQQELASIPFRNRKYSFSP